jgi:hypothetical protein
MTLIEISNVATPQALHRSTQAIACVRRHQKMHVVVHQNIGMHLNSVLTRHLAQRIEIAPSVVIVSEYCGLIVPTLNYLMRIVGKY